MTLALIGVNHKTAPIALREKIAIGRDELAETTRALASTPGVAECMIVSTCNRVELVAAVEGPDVPVAGFLASYFGIEAQMLAPHLYTYRDKEAVSHLFRMAASLDSMVVGEPQILGQVKEAFAVARAAGTVSSQLEHLLQSAFSAAKKARSETGIGSNSVSIASVAVDLAQQNLRLAPGPHRLPCRRGKNERAGRAASRAAGRGRHPRQQPHRRTRAPHWPRRLQRPSCPRSSTSTNSTKPPARRHRHQLHRRAASHLPPRARTGFPARPENRPMFFIDIAVPRDVEPEMNKLDGIFVYDIDDLQQVAASHMEERSREAIDAETLIAAEVERFHQRQRTVNAAPAIVALQRKAEEIRLAEIQRMHTRLGTLTAEQLAAVEALTRGLVNKFLHPPMQALKQAAREGDSARLDALCEEWSVCRMLRPRRNPRASRSNPSPSPESPTQRRQ